MMEEKLSKSVAGVDLSKDKFDVCLVHQQLDLGQRIKIKGTRTFDNTPSGRTAFKKWLSAKGKAVMPSVLMEATGTYFEQLAYDLYTSGYNVHVVLPNRARRYMQSLGLKSKNDSIDAKGLAYMGIQQSLQLWQPMSESMYALRALTRQIASLQKQKVSLANQKHALQQGMFSMDEITNGLDTLIDQVENQIKKLEASVKENIKQDPELHEKVERITKVKGLSVLSVATVLAETNGFELFKNQRQLVSYAGYDVVENSSGKHIGKTKISKKGNSNIRRILHMPSLTAVRCNEPHLTALFHRIYERTGIKKKGYVAVQKKLLVLIYALYRSGDDYQPTINSTSEPNQFTTTSNKNRWDETHLRKMKSTPLERTPL